MGAGARGVEAGDRRRVGQAVGEAEGVVDVVDVAAGDAEVLLDLLRVQREGVDHQVARCRARSDRRCDEQVLRRSAPPRRPRSCRRARTAPTARRAPSCGGPAASRSADRRWCGCTTRWWGTSGSRPACTVGERLAAARAITSSSSGSRWMVGPYWPRSSGRHVKRGSPRSARFTLKVVPSRR